jgi:hypothetical protein
MIEIPPSEVQKRFETLIQSNLDLMVALYLETFGNVLSTDNARELCEEYRQYPEARAQYGSAIHNVAGQLVAEVYRRLLNEPSGDNETDHVVFILGGGGGSGKSTVLNNINHLTFNIVTAIYDTTLSHLQNSIERIEQALEAGKQVSIVFIFRPVENAVKGAIRRALNYDGRCVPLKVLAYDHYQAPLNFLQLVERYQENEDVEFGVIDNSGGVEEIKTGTIELIHGNLYKSLDETLARVRKAFSDEYTEKKSEGRTFPIYIYKAFTEETLFEEED